MRFRRSLVGLKQTMESPVAENQERFRRSLVGLKPVPHEEARERFRRFRRSLVRLKTPKTPVAVPADRFQMDA